MPLTALRESACADCDAAHMRLETLLAQVTRRLEGGADASAAWTSFCQALLTRFRDEDQGLLGYLLSWSRRHAMPVVEEHRHLRARITELERRAGSGRAPSLERIRTFAHELHAHFVHERAVVRAWAGADARADDAVPTQTTSTDSSAAMSSSSFTGLVRYR